MAQQDTAVSPTIDVDVTGWDKRNVWPLHNGELAVRPALFLLYDASVGNARRCCAAFSIRPPSTNAVWHYFIDTSSSNTDLRAKILDENFVPIQDFALNLNKVPRVVTYALLGGDILITSPDFPSLYGQVGGALRFASKVDSVNPNTTAIDVPTGICVAWGGRIVIAKGGDIYFSDAEEAQTFVDFNVVDVEHGQIHGLHVTAEGALVICCEDSVQALPEDAAASGQIVTGVFTKLTDYQCIAYNTTATSHGRLFGLTKKGFRFVDGTSQQEFLLDEHMVNRTALGGRMAFQDYRQGKLFGGSFGPIATINIYSHLNDVATGLGSWWHVVEPTGGIGLNIVGILYDNDGTELYVTPLCVFRAYGNIEVADQPLSYGPPIAYVAGRYITPPETSPVLRVVQIESDTPTTLGCAVNGIAKTASPGQAAPVVGTASWDDGSTWRDAQVRSKQIQFAARTDDVQLELQVSDHPSRIPTAAALTFKGPGKLRRD